MEHLTYWDAENECWNYHCTNDDAAKRLAAYENTELEPQAIKNLVSQIARLKRQNGEAQMIGREMRNCIHNIDDALSRGKWAIEKACSHDPVWED